MSGVGGVEIDLNLLPASEIRLALNAATITVDLDGLPDDRMGDAAYQLLTPATFTLDPGDEQLVTLALATTWGGRYTGTLRLGSASQGDADENPFEIDVTALLFGAEAPLASEVRVIDASDTSPANAQVDVTGDFREIRRDTRFRGDDFLYAPAGGGFNTVAWTITGLDDEEPYQISATWAGGANRATDAPFTISVDGEDTTVYVNQNLAPHDFEEGGTLWEDLGTFLLPTGVTSLRVELSDNADGYVLADALRVAKLVTGEIAVEQLRDLAPSVPLVDEVSVVDFGYTELLPEMPVTKSFTVVNEGGAKLVVTDIHIPAGFRMEQSFDSLDALDGTPDGEIWLGAEGNTEGLSTWIGFDITAAGSYTGEIRFATNDIDETTFSVPLRATLTDSQTADDAGSQFGAIRGSFQTATRDTRAEGDAYAYHAAGDGNNAVQWLFTDLPAGVPYRVWATWMSGSNHATDAPFTVTSSASTDTGDIDALTPDIAVDVNQQIEPPIGGWYPLGVVNLDTGENTLAVRLSDDANGIVIADAVRIEQLIGPEIEVRVGGVVQQSGAAVDLGRVLQLSRAQQTVTITNVGSQPLELNLPSLDTGIDFTLLETLDSLDLIDTVDDDLITLARQGGTGAASVTFTVDLIADAARLAVVDLLVAASGSDWGIHEPQGASRGYQPGDAYSTSPAASAVPLASAAIQPAFDQAVSLWAAAGLTAEQTTRLNSVNVRVANLSGAALGAASAASATIWIDSTAAGYGWDVDRGVMAAVLEPSTSGVWSGNDWEAADDRLPKSLAPVHVALASLADQTSGVFGTSASRTPTSDLDNTSTLRIPPSAWDTLFARLDRRAGELTDVLLADEPDEDDRERDREEDALDLWSVLYGLE